MVSYNSDRIFVLGRRWLSLTNRFHLYINARRHDLVEAINHDYEPSGTTEAPSATERMRERRRRGEEFLDRGTLNGGRGLGEEADNGGDLLDFIHKIKNAIN